MYPAIPYLADILGHSVIYEEHKGNFAHAREVGEGELIYAQRSGERSRIADALFARGLVHLLQGEPPQAIQCFEEVHQIDPSDGNRCLRAINYSNLATYWLYDHFPDGNWANATELQVRWNSHAYAESLESERQAALPQASVSEVKVESLFVHQFLGNLLPSRSFVQASCHRTTSTMTDQLLQFALQSIEGFRKKANHVAPVLVAYADLAAADLCYRAGDGQLAELFLKQALASYQQNKDLQMRT